MSNNELEGAGLIGSMEKRIAELEQQRNELIIELQGLYRGYINTLEYGRDRIISLGGKCDQLEIMERDDPRLISARKIIAKTKGGAA